MTLDPALWRMVRCVACGRQADHALELLVTVPRGTLTPVVVGFCASHYARAKRLPQWKDLSVVEAPVLEPKGVG